MATNRRCHCLTFPCRRFPRCQHSHPLETPLATERPVSVTGWDSVGLAESSSRRPDVYEGCSLARQSFCMPGSNNEQ